MPERECPACTRPMSTGRLGPIPLDLCMHCGGVWFDCGELGQVVSAGPQIVRRLVSGLPAAPASAPKRGNPKCPVCHVPLAGTEYANMHGVAVECCSFCEGVFASRTTLDRLIASLEGASQWDHVVAAARGATSAAPAARPAAPAAAPPPAVAPADAHPCPSCGEINASRSSTCWACGKPLMGPAVGACPSCRGTMRRLESQGVTFNACEACAGVFINPGRLNALIRQPDDQIDRGVVRPLERFGKGATRPSSSPSCAECGVSMVPVSLRTLSPKPVPSCTSCFSLFISKELLQEILLSRRAGPRPAPAAAPAATAPAAIGPAAAGPAATSDVACEAILAQGLADRLAKARLIRTWRGMFGVSPTTGASYLAMRFEATGRITILQLPTEPGPASPVSRIPPDVHWAE